MEDKKTSEIKADDLDAVNGGYRGKIDFDDKFGHRAVCPYCESIDTVHVRVNHDGCQVYKCNACGRESIDDPDY